MTNFLVHDLDKALDVCPIVKAASVVTVGQAKMSLYIVAARPPRAVVDLKGCSSFDDLGLAVRDSRSKNE